MMKNCYGPCPCCPKFDEVGLKELDEQINRMERELAESPGKLLASILTEQLAKLNLIKKEQEMKLSGGVKGIDAKDEAEVDYTIADKIVPCKGTLLVHKEAPRNCIDNPLKQCSQNNIQMGRVVALGAGIAQEGLQEGTTILFIDSRVANSSIMFKGEPYRIVKEEDISGIVLESELLYIEDDVIGIPETAKLPATHTEFSEYIDEEVDLKKLFDMSNKLRDRIAKVSPSGTVYVRSTKGGRLEAW